MNDAQAKWIGDAFEMAVGVPWMLKQEQSNY